jgi:hypothetical protein
MLIPLSEAAYYAEQAGFSGNSLATILAITLRESGARDANGNFTGLVDTTARNPGSGAYGLLQFNPDPRAFGPGVLAIAGDPAAAYEFAHQVTNGGRNFAPWGCDAECGYGATIIPDSPSTVVGARDAAGNPTGPIHLPSDFWSIVGSSPTGVAAPSPLPAGPLGPQGPQGGPSTSAGTSSPSSPQSILGGLFGTQQAGLSFLQNAGVGVIGLVLLLGGFLIIAAPPLVSAAAGAAGGEATGAARAAGRGAVRGILRRARPSRGGSQTSSSSEPAREANASDFTPDQIRKMRFSRRAA